MRAKLLVLMGAALLAVVGASATTLALLSDAAPAQALGFTAGIVALYSYRDMGDTVNGPMFYTTADEGRTQSGQPGLSPTGFWAPGDTHMRVLIVKNDGNLDAWLTQVGADLVGGSRHLAEKMTYRVSLDKNGTRVLAQGNLGDLLDTDTTFSSKVALAAQPSRPLSQRTPLPIYFHLTLPADADNSYQGEALRVDFTIAAEQKRGNP